MLSIITSPSNIKAGKLAFLGRLFFKFFYASKQIAKMRCVGGIFAWQPLEEECFLRDLCDVWPRPASDKVWKHRQDWLRLLSNTTNILICHGFKSSDTKLINNRRIYDMCCSRECKTNPEKYVEANVGGDFLCSQLFAQTVFRLLAQYLFSGPNLQICLLRLSL